jgi:hypothetical protein
MPKSTKVYVNAQGQTVPAQYLSEYEKLRDKIARKIAVVFIAEQAKLRSIKESVFALVAQLQAAALKDTDVERLGGDQGYIQFRSFDGLVTVRVDNAKRTEFDERLQIAQQLVIEAVKELSGYAKHADLVEISTKAFQPRRNGNLDMQRIRELKTYKVEHPKWKQAVEIINECERVIGHRRYIRVSIKADRNSEPENIILDIASV